MLSALWVFLLFSTVESVDPVGRLITRKTILSTALVAEQDILVNIFMHNVGSRPVYDVSVTDNWPDGFEATVGLDSALWENIPPDGNVNHTYMVRSRKGGEFFIGPAKVQYRQSSAGDFQIGYSTAPGSFLIESASEFRRRTAPHLREWFIYSLLALLVIVAPFSYWTYCQLTISNIRQGSARKTKDK